MVALTFADGRSAVRAVARSSEELESIRAAWDSFEWPRPDADPEFLAAVIETAAVPTRPHVAVVGADGAASGMLVARIEDIAFEIAFGYKILFRPRLRTLTVAHGGIAGPPEAQLAALAEVERALAESEADAAVLPGLRADSVLYAAALSAGGALTRGRVARPQTHRRLVLPPTYAEFLQARSRSTREGVKRYSNRLEREFGARISVRTHSEFGGIDELGEALDEVAALTYQRGLGVAFADNGRDRRLMELGLERGWFRAWVLYLDDRPVAFWHGQAYRGTFFIGTPGYDPALAELRVGTYVLMRAVADLCSDQAVHAVDYGFGDAEYKRRFSSESWKEADVCLFARRTKPVSVNLLRSSVTGAADLARAALSRAGLEDRLKRRWRRHLAA